MSKRKNIEIPIPNWTWWQTTRALFIIIIAIRIDINDEIISLLKEVIKWLSG